MAPLALSPATNVEPENHATFFPRMATDGDAWQAQMKKKKKNHGLKFKHQKHDLTFCNLIKKNKNDGLTCVNYLEIGICS